VRPSVDVLLPEWFPVAHSSRGAQLCTPSEDWRLATNRSWRQTAASERRAAVLVNRGTQMAATSGHPDEIKFKPISGVGPDKAVYPLYPLRTSWSRRHPTLQFKIKSLTQLPLLVRRYLRTETHASAAQPRGAADCQIRVMRDGVDVLRVMLVALLVTNASAAGALPRSCSTSGFAAGGHPHQAVCGR
jgi:hypothetical protein